MHHLTGGVHTSIRAAGTHCLNRMIGHFGDRGFEVSLDGAAVMGLPLPAHECRTVVFKAKCKARHQDRGLGLLALIKGKIASLRSGLAAALP